jgi:NAD(P)-dependent dehydrogenase (short-subunit alcohol dehydrogenase family)
VSGRPLAGRSVLVTGASSGIGRATALALAAEGARVLMVCRDAARGEAARREAVERSGNPDVEVLLADLASQADVRRLAAELLSRRQALHVLVNNAGILEPRRRLGPDGIELTWATNVLGYFLLTTLLQGRLRECAPSRIVNVASELAGGLDLDDVEFQRRPYAGQAAYAQSKQADRMLTWATARRLSDAGVAANAMHPGGVHTPLLARFSGLQGAAADAWARSVGRTPEQGADTVVWLAASPEVEGVSGRFWIDRRQVACRFRDEAQEERLFARCASMAAA